VASTMATNNEVNNTFFITETPLSDSSIRPCLKQGRVTDVTAADDAKPRMLNAPIRLHDCDCDNNSPVLDSGDVDRLSSQVNRELF